MGICIRDHSEEEIFEKLRSVGNQLPLDVSIKLEEGLNVNKWDQLQLNELFHALKKLEKDLPAEERDKAMESIYLFAGKTE
jgi:hypothetical protein